MAGCQTSKYTQMEHITFLTIYELLLPWKKRFTNNQSTINEVFYCSLASRDKGPDHQSHSTDTQHREDVTSAYLCHRDREDCLIDHIRSRWTYCQPFQEKKIRLKGYGKDITIWKDGAGTQQRRQAQGSSYHYLWIHGHRENLFLQKFRSRQDDQDGRYRP